MPHQRHMLDTNTASYIIKGHPTVKQHLLEHPMSSLCISSITEAELLRGVAKKPEATHLKVIVTEFLIRLDILPWDSDAANAYATLRTACEKMGKSLGTMDMLIAAHAVAVNACLVTHDRDFYQIDPLLDLIDWM